MFLGLAVVGGVYVFGVVGAVYGPLVLCVLYVIISLYTSYIQVSYIVLLNIYQLWNNTYWFVA